MGIKTGKQRRRPSPAARGHKLPTTQLPLQLSLLPPHLALTCKQITTNGLASPSPPLLVLSSPIPTFSSFFLHSAPRSQTTAHPAPALDLPWGSQGPPRSRDSQPPSPHAAPLIFCKQCFLLSLPWKPPNSPCAVLWEYDPLSAAASHPQATPSRRRQPSRLSLYTKSRNQGTPNSCPGLQVGPGAAQSSEPDLRKAQLDNVQMPQRSAGGRKGRESQGKKCQTPKIIPYSVQARENSIKQKPQTTLKASPKFIKLLPKEINKVNKCSIGKVQNWGTLPNGKNKGKKEERKKTQTNWQKIT